MKLKFTTGFTSTALAVLLIGAGSSSTKAETPQEAERWRLTQMRAERARQQEIIRKEHARQQQEQIRQAEIRRRQIAEHQRFQQQHNKRR